MRRRVTAALLVSAVVIAVAFRWDARDSGRTSLKAGSPAETRTGVAGEHDGPIEAALRYVRSSGQLLSSGPIGRTELLRHLVTARLVASQASAVEADVSSIQSRLADGGRAGLSVSQLRWAEFPLTASVGEPIGGRAVVRVWSVALFGAPQLEVTRAAWRTFTMTLRAEGATWLVDDVEVKAGPTPTDDGTLATSSFDEVDQVVSWPPVEPGRGGRT